jgi:hypothetical protein
MPSRKPAQQLTNGDDTHACASKSDSQVGVQDCDRFSVVKGKTNEPVVSVVGMKSFKLKVSGSVGSNLPSWV